MKIYTKTGDQGQTGLWGGKRVPKDDLRIQAYGTLDELNATLGVALAQEGFPQIYRPMAMRIQAELFQLGAELATPADKSTTVALIGDAHALALEHEIDAMETKLPPLKNFILPGGSLASAQIHFARTVCRRAERALITLHRAEPVRGEVLRYVNRLADHLFVLARAVALDAGAQETAWLSPRA